MAGLLSALESLPLSSDVLAQKLQLLRTLDNSLHSILSSSAPAQVSELFAECVCPFLGCMSSRLTKQWVDIVPKLQLLCMLNDSLQLSFIAPSERRYAAKAAMYLLVLENHVWVPRPCAQWWAEVQLLQTLYHSLCSNLPSSGHAMLSKVSHTSTAVDNVL